MAHRFTDCEVGVETIFGNTHVECTVDAANLIFLVMAAISDNLEETINSKNVDKMRAGLDAVMDHYAYGGGVHKYTFKLCEAMEWAAQDDIGKFKDAAQKSIESLFRRARKIATTPSRTGSRMTQNAALDVLKANAATYFGVKC